MLKRVTTDLLLLLSDFDLTHCALLSDATGDCTVNTPDLLALLAAFGTSNAVRARECCPLRAVPYMC